MKVALHGISGIPTGRHNVKDPRVDQVHALVEAKKRTYAQVDVVSEVDIVTADAIVVRAADRLELILSDLEFVETRLERNPPDLEHSALAKIKSALEAEKLASEAGLTAAETAGVETHALLTSRPVVVASDDDLARFNEFLVRVLHESGHISFLTVGGPENRAWLIKQGMTAPEAAGVIHSDIQAGFIRAEVISFADCIEAGGETQAKRANKMRLETKPYVVQDCDLINFRFNK